jgi:hypothetical protein
MVSQKRILKGEKRESYPACLQKNQIGVVLFTVTVMVGTWVALAATGMKPESMPPDMGRHGAAKVDCVTVWFLGMKVNSRVSPGFAVTDEGLNWRPPPPTVTWMFAASTEVARVARVEVARAKRILKKLIFGKFSKVKPRKRAKAG